MALIVVVPLPASAQGLQIPCTLLLQGAPPPNFLTITAVVNCIDPEGFAVTTTIAWGDGSTFNTDTGSVTATHTYSQASCHAEICEITVTARSDDTNTGTVSVFVDLSAPANPVPVFAGQTSVVQVSILSLPAEAGLQVTFECTTVTDSNGGIHQAADLGITCNSNPPTITLAGGVQTVSIAIHTSGSATASLAPGMHGSIFCTLLLPLPVLFLLGVRIGTTRSCSGATLQFVGTEIVLMLILMFSSCGGGFAAPKIVQATPAGSYQVTIIDQPAPGQSLTGFVQTSLIVPLTVNQVQ